MAFSLGHGTRHSVGLNKREEQTTADRTGRRRTALLLHDRQEGEKDLMPTRHGLPGMQSFYACLLPMPAVPFWTSFKQEKVVCS